MLFTQHLKGLKVEVPIVFRWMSLSFCLCKQAVCIAYDELPNAYKSPFVDKIKQCSFPQHTFLILTCTGNVYIFNGKLYTLFLFVIRTVSDRPAATCVTNSSLMSFSSFSWCALKFLKIFLELSRSPSNDRSIIVEFISSISNVSKWIL